MLDRGKFIPSIEVVVVDPYSSDNKDSDCESDGDNNSITMSSIIGNDDTNKQ